MDALTLTCDDCGGKGIDVGSLYEPEACTVCQGAGVVFVELSPSSSHYGQRKPIGRAPLPQMTAGDFVERTWRVGE